MITLTKPEGLAEEMFWQGMKLLDEELAARKTGIQSHIRSAPATKFKPIRTAG